MTDAPVWFLSHILEATGATLLAGDPRTVFPGIGTDSRKPEGTALFVALKGEHFDGHDFIPQALKAGYGGVLMDKSRFASMPSLRFDSKTVFIGVDNTLKALGDLARHRLKNLGTRVLAVTGSNGKTSTKEMLGCIFRKTAACLVTQGNFNNEVGLPLTLFRLKPEDRWAILELGMNHPGEMTRLSAICQPDMALITRIAPAHLEGLGSVEGVARAKGELLSGMTSGKTLLINGSDPNSVHIPLKSGIQVLRFGRDQGCDVFMDKLVSDATGSRFQLHHPDHPPFDLELAVPGTMMAENALAAAAAALHAGLPPKTIQEGLMDFRGFPGRFQLLHGPAGATLINDTYNANPDSMRAALEQLASLGKSGRRFAILGSMGELGKEAPALHREVGALAARTGVTALYGCGTHGPDLVEGARKAGLTHSIHENKETLAARILPELRAGDWVLIKGSRSMTMETLVDSLMRHAAPSSRN